MIYIVMGVSGCGKSSMGKRLAKAIGAQFFDADHFHSASSVEKMRMGIALGDSDREPWLQELAQHMVQWNSKGDTVLACSALKEKYRQTLSAKIPESVKFIYLKGSKRVIAERISGRKKHFMATSLLDSQFHALEEPKDAIIVSIARSPKKVLQSILEQLSSLPNLPHYSASNQKL